MILALAILLPLLGVSLWLFLRAQRKAPFEEKTKRYNIATVGVVFATCSVITLYFWQTTGQGNDRAWWPILAVLASVVASIIVLAAASAVRTMLFRSSSAR